MKVTVQNKKGLNKDLKVFVDKKTLEKYLNEKYEEVSKTVQLKGFRPGKVPKEILKRQFGKAVYGEVLDKVLKETSTKDDDNTPTWNEDLGWHGFNKVNKKYFSFCKALSLHF